METGRLDCCARADERKTNTDKRKRKGVPYLSEEASSTFEPASALTNRDMDASIARIRRSRSSIFSLMDSELARLPNIVLRAKSDKQREPCRSQAIFNQIGRASC